LLGSQLVADFHSNMGLFCIPVRKNMIEAIPEVMRVAGFPITRIERTGKQTNYYLMHPKRSIEISFYLTDPLEKSPSFFMMGLSRTYIQIVAVLRKAGVFEAEKPRT